MTKNEAIKEPTDKMKLYEQIIQKDNIILAINKIKSNQGSRTPGVDGKVMTDLLSEGVNKLVEEIQSKFRNYNPKPVRRIMIPKMNGKLRPLGIPCMIDRIIQQCIKQIIEPICEDKFYKHSYGFRPGRSVENCVARINNLIGNRPQLHYVVTIDIENFFDNVNHSKLLKQLWGIGVKDKTVLAIISKILRAKTQLSNGSLLENDKGTPQGGVLSPLLANIVLNSLDWFISDKWETTKTNHEYQNVSNKYRELKKTKRIKQFIVRYADDFAIFTDTYEHAQIINAVTRKYIDEKLYLKVNAKKSRIVNVKKSSFDFLGFSFRAVPNTDKTAKFKYNVRSHISKKALNQLKKKCNTWIDELYKHRTANDAKKYNSRIRGVINYYNIASMVNRDFCNLYDSIQYKLKKKFKCETTYLTSKSYKMYYPTIHYKTNWVAGVCLFPLYSNFRIPKNYCYRTETDKFKRNVQILKENVCDDWDYTRYYVYRRDKGICQISGEFVSLEKFDVHHILPRSKGGDDSLSNLITINRAVHQMKTKELHNI